MTKKSIGFILGLLSFFLMFALGEAYGALVAFIVTGFYYLFCQYALSRGNADALFGDWPLILALNTTLILTAILVLWLEPDAKYHALIAVVSVLGSIAGAAIAAWKAKHH